LGWGALVLCRHLAQAFLHPLCTLPHHPPTLNPTPPHPPPQVRAIIEAAINVTGEGCSVHPHIMIPLVAIEDELLNQTAIVKETAAEVMKALGKEVPYKVRCLLVLGSGA